MLLYIDTTFMRYGYGPGGIVGITLNERALCRWALNLHISPRLTKDNIDLKEATLVEEDLHKEYPSRIKTDGDDRNAIRDKLETCVDPLDASQGQTLINIVTGMMSMLKTRFRLEKTSCKKLSQPVSQDSSKRSTRGRFLPWSKARRSEA